MNLYNGECLDVMGRLPDNCIDMVMCDLPYGMTACKWDSVIPLEPLWREYKRLCRGAIVLTAAQPFTSVLVMSNIDGFQFHWVWEKPKATGHLYVNSRPMRAHEDVLIFGKSIYNPQKIQGGTPYKARGGDVKKETTYDFYTKIRKDNDDGSRYPRSVVLIQHETKPIHPTQKPVALMEYLIRTYSNEGMTVLDNTMGSGTTGVACVNTNRKFIGIERDTNFFNIAQARIADAMLAKLI